MNEIARRPIPRRTVAKGAAWAVPAVVVGSAAAANTQVSPDPDEPVIVNCPTSPEELCFRNYSTDIIGGTRTSQWVLEPKGPESGPGTKFFGVPAFKLGSWKFDKACLPQGYYADGSPAKIRYYKLNTGKEHTIKVRTVKEDPNGTPGVNYTWSKGKKDYWGNDEWEGYFATRPDGLARSVSVPFGYASIINCNMPYSSTITNPAFGLGKPDKPYELLMISFPFSITFQSSLTRPVTHLPADDDECGGFYMNIVVKGGGAGGTYYAVRKDGGLLTEQESFITYGLPEL